MVGTYNLKNGKSFRGETFNYRKDGTEYRVMWSITPIKDGSGETIAYIAFQKDMSPEYFYKKRLKIFQTVIDNSSTHIGLLDRKMEFFYINNSFLERTGYTKNEILGKNLLLLNFGNHDETFYQNFYEQLANGKKIKEVFINKNAYGIEYYELQSIEAIYNEEGIIGYSIIGNPYDDEIEKQNSIIQSANTDALTGLLNRKYFKNILGEFLENYKKNLKPFCMFFGDLDNFKYVNDTFGHDVGDEVLKTVAKVLKSKLRKNDYIFRYGGDEFLWFINDLSINESMKIEQKICNEIRENETLKKYKIGISIGISEYEGEEIEEFFRQTDQRMYQKKKNKNIK